mmetsp:Transcript_36050/g.78647  ORF Transcript_36050/g.78647 Transcript_36050/m.78647 type:complete len:100 (+) Transcript_36050:15-314(+)
MAKRLGTRIQTKLTNKFKKLRGRFWQIHEDVYKREGRPGEFSIYTIFRTGPAAPYWERSKIGKVYAKATVDKILAAPLQTTTIKKKPSSARTARPWRAL